MMLSFRLPIGKNLPEIIMRIWPRGYKTFFMLNSAEHEIFSAIKYENANYAQLCLAGKNLQLLVISNLRIISRTNFMLS